MKERIGIDLMRNGALENQIGAMVLKRIFLSSDKSQACEKALIKSGEDPSNDELVLIEIKFQCESLNFIYDPRELLTTHSQRSWQIIIVSEGSDQKEYFEGNAFYCDPENVDSIRDAILKAYETPFNEEFKKHIATFYNWEQTAEQTKQCYLQLLNR